MRSLTRLLVVPALLTLAVPVASQQLKPKHFFPKDYSGEVMVDFKALRESGLWDGIERSMFKIPLGMFAEEFGFGFDDLDRIRVLPGPLHDDDNRHYRGSVSVFEGNEQVGYRPGLKNQGAEEVEIGGHDVLEVKKDYLPGGGEIHVCPSPGVLIFGDSDLIRPTLEGTHKGGVPHPDIMSLLTGRGVLLRFVFALTPKDIENDFGFKTVAEMVHWDPEDPPQLMMVRAVQKEVEGEDHVFFEASVQFRSGAKSLATVQKFVEEQIDVAKKHPRLGALKWVWSNLKIEADGAELRVTLDLGTTRQAAGQLPMLLAPIAMFGMMAQPQEVEIIEVAPATPATELEPVKPAGKGDKKGGKKGGGQ